MVSSFSPLIQSQLTKESKNKKQKKRPFVPQDIQGEILDALCTLLAPVGERNRSLKSIRSHKHKLEQQRKKLQKTGALDAVDTAHAAVATVFDPMELEDTPEPPLPSVLQHTVTGINAITKKLERMIQTPEQQDNALELIFVCKADISPPHLCAHLPLMAGLVKAKIDGKEEQRQVRLCPLGKGAQDRLSTAIGRGRCSVVAFRVSGWFVAR